MLKKINIFLYIKILDTLFEIKYTEWLKGHKDHNYLFEFGIYEFMVPGNQTV